MYYRRYSGINKNVFLSLKATALPNSVFWFDDAFQDGRKLFFMCMWGRGRASKNVGHRSWPTTNTFKIALAKAVSKNEICTRKCLKASYLQFSYFRFSGRKSQNQQKLAKNILHFTIQFCSKVLAHFTNIIKNILPQYSQKHDSDWCQKTFALHQTPKICFLGALGKQVSFISLQIFFWRFLFQRRRKLLTGGGWVITYRHITDWNS